MALSEDVLKRIQSNIASGKVKVGTGAQSGTGVKPAPAQTRPDVVRQRLDIKGIVPEGVEKQKEAFYSRPNVDTDMEAAHTRFTSLESTMKEKSGALKTAQTGLKTTEESVTFWAGKAKALADRYSQQPQDITAALYDKVYGHYEQSLKDYEAAAKTYDAAYLAYKPIEEAYNNAVSQYQGYADQLAQWKNTVRDSGTVQGELAELQKQIARQEAHERQAARTVQPGAYLQGAGGVQTPYGAALSAPQIGKTQNSPEMQALLDRQTLLMEELDWSRQFAQETEDEKWRSTARDVKTVEGELAALEEQIARREAHERQAARTVQPGAYLQGAGGVQTPYGAALSAPQIEKKQNSPEMQALLDRQTLLLEELDWSRQFAQETEDEKWRSTARDVSTVKAELAALEEQIALQEAHERQAARTVQPGAYLQGAGGVQTPYGAALSAPRIGETTSPQMQALLDKREQLETELGWSKGNYYAALAGNTDFQELSKYRSTRNGNGRIDPLRGVYTDTGFEDTAYDYINRNEEAVRRRDINALGDSSSLLGMDGSQVKEMKDEEIATFNYLYATEGREAAYEYIAWLNSDLNKRQRKTNETAARKFAEEHPVIASLGSIAGAPLKGISYLGQAADLIADGRIDQNAGYNKFSYSNSAVRDQVSKTIEKNEHWGKAGSFLYQTAMSMGDFLLTSGITGGSPALALTVMGTGAAADTVIAAKDRGLSDGQAFALGTVAGLAEAVTEKVSLDALLNADLLKDSTWKYILKNMLAEGSEEVGSDLINLTADILISKEKSEWQTAVNDYMRSGMSESQAVGQAVKDQALTLGLDFLGGAISGGIMGGGNAAVQISGLGGFLEKADLDEAYIRVMVEAGLESGPDTKAYHIAQSVQKKLDAGKSVTKWEVGRLHQANIIAINAEQQAQQEKEAREAEEPQGLRLPTLEDETARAQQPGQNNTLNGGTRYADTYEQQPGAGVLPGGGQRYDGAGTPEQIRQLARRPGATEEDRRAKADRVRIAAERRNLVQDLRTGKVSARSLGIASGTEQASLQVIPEERWDDGMRQKAQQVYEETGKPVTYVVGAIEVQGTAGKTVTAKGVITDTGIVVRADHIQYTAEQIADHEAYHGMKDLYKGMRDGNGRTVEEAMVQRIRERYTPEAFDRVVEQYILALDGLMDVQGAETRQQYEARIEAVVEEVLADAYAGMNMWDAGATQFTDTVREFMEENNISRKPGAENGVRETNGPPANGQKDNTAGYGGERYSISNQEMQNVQSIGRKSANTFTTRDIKLADSLAKRYWVEMGVKSPFFRAWFGDWRINDVAPIQFANQHGDTRGVQKNIDTGWDIQVSGKVFNETKRHTDSYNIAAQPYLAVINDIVRKAILLDSYGADPQKLKSPNTLLMHSLYAVADTGNGPEIIKLYVEEMNNPNSEQTGKRAYQLQDIEKYQLQNGSSQNTASSISSATGSIHTVADLFTAVKRYDADFNPKPCSIITNADGTPKVMYHGTRAENGDFYVFDESKAIRKGGLGLKALGKGNYFTAKKLNGTERYGSRVIAAYLNIRNPFVCKGGISFYEQVRNELGIDPQIGADAVQQEMRKLGYDGVIQYDGNGEVSLAVTFDSEQIKSATDNIGTFDGSNPDIRYSVDTSSEGEEMGTADYDALEKEFRAKQQGEKERFLRERLGDDGYEKFKTDREATKYRKKADDAARTRAARLVETNRRKLRLEAETQKIDHAERRRLRDETKPVEAKKVLHDTVLNLFSIPAGQRSELGSMLDSYADRLLKNGSLTEEDRQRIFDRMYDSGVMTLPADEYFETGRNMLRGGRVYVSDQIRQEFGDDWNDIRRKLFANKIYVTGDRDAGGIDSWNHELASLLPGLFHEEDTDLRDILERILYVAEQGQEEKLSLAEYAAKIAGEEYISEKDFQDNIERQLDWALRTFATSAGIEIKTREEYIRKQSSTRRQNLKLQATLAAERQERREKAEAAKARKELRELQQKTLKTLRWLNQNHRRAPEELRKAFDEVLGDIDLLAVGAANEMNWSDKYNATWKDLAQMYKDAQSNDPNFMPSKDLENIVHRLDATKIGDMDLGALQNLYRAAVGLQHEFHNRQNILKDERNRQFAEVYTDAKGELADAPSEDTGKRLDKLFNEEQLTPMNLMQRMGGWDPDGTFYSMAKQLEKGERDMRRYHVMAQQMLQTFMEENQEWIKKADGQGKDAIWYEMEVPKLVQLRMGDQPIFGATVKVYFTPAQKVHMYLESKNLDNLRHMTGGRTFVNKELYSQGKRKDAFAKGTTIRLAPETVKKIVSDLTEEEMALAKVLEQYYNSFAAGEINRVSNILNGYDKAMGSYYAPIYTNTNYTKTEFGVFDVTAEGVGNLKERIWSATPSLNIGAFDAFERHVDHTARYVGMAIPVRNWETLMNWREENWSMLESVTHKWGADGKEYITNLVNALQGGERYKKDIVSTGADKLQSNYISAIFGANPSIVLKQLGSIPMASAYLGTANAPKLGQLKNIDRELISKYTKELDWRLMGYATPETKHLKDNPNWTQSNKAFRFVFGGDAITAMDGWAASTLWPWAENKVRKEHPELEIGTQEQIDKGESPFYKKVAEEFDNALVRSQSVSDEIHQSHLRKSKNPITRAFTMFRSDSAQTYNAIRQKIGEARYYARTGDNEKALKAAKRAVGEAFGAMLINASWASAISFLMALWKNKAKNYRDDEGELTAASVAGTMVSDMVGSVAGVATGGEELYDLVGNILTGDKWYSIETPGMEQLNDVMEIIYESGSGMRDLIAGGWDIVKNGGDLGKYFDDHSGDILGSIKQIAEAATQYVAGLPASNVEAYLLGSLKWVSPKLGVAYDDMFSDSGKASLAGMTGDALESRIGGILDQRGISKAEGTAGILAGLYEADHKAAVPGDVPGSVSVDGEQRKLSPYQQQAYDAAWSSAVSEGLDELVDSALFRSGDADLQERMLKNLYTYAAEKAKEAVFDDYMVSSSTVQIAKLIKEGISLADAVAWRSATSEMKTGEKLGLLKEWTIGEDEKAAFVGAVFGGELKTESGKPTQYAKFRYSVEQGMSVDEYLEVYTNGGNVDKYLEMMHEGVDHDAAQYYAEEVEELVPLENKGSIADIQKWRIAVDASRSEEQQMTMLYILMEDGQYEKVEIAHEYGVSPDTYVRLQEILPEYDTDNSGGYKQAEIQAAIDALAEEKELSKNQRAALWQVVTGAKKANKNPYSPKVGQEILDAKEAAKADPEDEEENLSFGEVVMRQLMSR